MKKIFVLALLVGGFTAAFAQSLPFKIKLSQADKLVYLRMDQVSASITGYDGDEIIIEALPDPNKQVPAEAKGLKLVPITGREVDNYTIDPRIKEDSLKLSITIPSVTYKYLSIKVPQTARLRVEMFSNVVNGRLIVKYVNAVSIGAIVPSIKISEVSSFDLSTGGAWFDPKADHLSSGLYGKIMVIDGHVVKKPIPSRDIYTSITDGKVTNLRINGKDHTNKKDIDSLLKTTPVDIVDVKKTPDTVKKMKVNGTIYTTDLPFAMMNLPAEVIDKMPGGGTVTISGVRWSNQAMIINGKTYPRFYVIGANSADIDLSVPADIKANILFYSAKGMVYSGLNSDPVSPTTDEIASFAKWFHNEPLIKAIHLNGGGYNIRLDNNTGNIYLRKQD